MCDKKRFGQTGGMQRWREHLSDLLEIAGNDPAAHRHVLEEFGRRPEEATIDHVAAVRRCVNIACTEQLGSSLVWHTPCADNAAAQIVAPNRIVYQVLEV